MIILPQQTVTGVATSTEFLNEPLNNIAWILVRDPLGGVSFNLLLENPEKHDDWMSLTNNKLVVQRFSPLNDCSIRIELPSTRLNLKINQTAGTSASYQVIQ